MNQDPEARNLPELLLGHQVFVEYLKGPDITPERLEHVIADEEILKGEPEARTAALFFAASIVAALGGMESVLAERHRGDPDKPPRSAFWPMPLRPD
jgi:hypothetical protein